MSAILQHIIIWLIGRLAGASREDWEHVLSYVKKAAQQFSAGGDKWKWVKEQIGQQLPHLSSWAGNLLLELAVGYLNKKPARAA